MQYGGAADDGAECAGGAGVVAWGWPVRGDFLCGMGLGGSEGWGDEFYVKFV